MAFLRTENKKSGKYLRIVESFRDELGKTRQRILYSIGKVEYYTPEQLQRIGSKLYELGGGNLKELLGITTSEKARYNYGYYQVYHKAFKNFGLDYISKNIQKKHKLSFDFQNALLLMLIERLHDPCSKRSTYFNQSEYINIKPVKLQHLYRALDKLADYNKLIQKQIYQTGRDLFNQKLDVVFYDVTTLYFDSEVEDENSIRQTGFSKDGKIGKTQILFCMLIDSKKQPIGYRVFKGSQFEGHTFIHAIEDLRREFQIDNVIVVADRGMLSGDNLKIVVDQGYEFIVGERLRTLPKAIKSYLIDLNNYQQQWKYIDNLGKEILVKFCTIVYKDRTIIGTFSAKRARKDQHTREQRLLKAKKLLANPANIEKKAARYFLKKGSKETYVLNEDKIAEDQKYDGFLAIATNNTELATDQVLDQYKQLYKIEHSFRTFKSHLETRPMFHWTDKRIEGHICMCYIAYTLLNHTLLKINAKSDNFTETSLRKVLDKMQLSLIEHGSKEVLLRSAQNEKDVIMQKCLGLKPLPNIFPVGVKSQYI
jgi:transposase